MAQTWTFDDMPDQTGRTAVVTGATSGLGLVAAEQLAAHGATVLMAVRDVAKGERVRAGLRGDLEVHELDLADLDSVRSFAARLRDSGRRIDVLLNNAGIGARERVLTPQGQESTFATNHLGHFALTGLLLDLFRPDHDPRVVTVSSNLYRVVRDLGLDDLTAARSFSPGRAYSRSKLANTLFGAELDRRLRAAGSAVRSFLAHPGMARTPMNQNPPRPAERAVVAVISALAARTAEQGTLPMLFAATSPDAATGVLLGPGLLRKWDTRVHFAPLTASATDRALATRLWNVSQDLTGVTYLARPAGAPLERSSGTPVL